MEGRDPASTAKDGVTCDDEGPENHSIVRNMQGLWETLKMTLEIYK